MILILSLFLLAVGIFTPMDAQYVIPMICFKPVVILFGLMLLVRALFPKSRDTRQFEAMNTIAGLYSQQTQLLRTIQHEHNPVIREQYWQVYRELDYQEAVAEIAYYLGFGERHDHWNQNANLASAMKHYQNAVAELDRNREETK